LGATLVERFADWAKFHSVGGIQIVTSSTSRSIPFTEDRALLNYERFLPGQRFAWAANYRAATNPPRSGNTDWVRETDQTKRLQLAHEVQKVALSEVTYVPWGEWVQPTAKNVQDVLKFGAPIFWNAKVT